MRTDRCSKTKNRKHVWTKWRDPFDVVRVKSLGHFDYKADDHVWIQERVCIHCNYRQARDIFHGKVVGVISG